MDNFRILVIHKNYQELALTLRIAFDTRGNATHYVIHPEKGFVLCRHEDLHLKTHPFPIPLTSETAADMVYGWLTSLATYPSEDIDSDVSYERGWEAYNEDWGHILGSDAAIIAVKPAWILYGK